LENGVLLVSFLKLARPIIAAAMFAALPLSGAFAEATAPQLAAAREVMIASGMAKSFAQIVPGIMEQLAVNVVKTRPELQKDLKEVLLAAVGDFKQVQEDLVSLSAKLLSRDLNEKELTEIAAFFNSPTGQKYVATQPKILDALGPYIRDYTVKLSTDVTTRVRADMKKRGHDM
jgi:uncharacterized protein